MYAIRSYYAVAVGFIALAGVAAETGVVMLIYLEQAWRQQQARVVITSYSIHYTKLYDRAYEGTTR